MIDETQRDTGLDNERLADLAERIARGGTAELAHFQSMTPGESEAIERLLPAIRLLSELAGEPATAEFPAYVAPPLDVLGDFELTREIGRGGLGVVYEARQRSLGRRVAVKVLAPSSRLDPRKLRRFEIEAQAAAALQHPNIVPVFAYGNEFGVPYLAMRLIEGRNLAEVIRDLRERMGQGLPPREAAELARQAAEAIDYAHRHDVLHRDIKPSNMLLDADRRLWIADFGLARFRGDSDLTASGDVIGTLRYLSPEQAMGRRGPLDGRSDVYALGATLYELLTLRPVFEGDDRAELLIRIATEEPRFVRKLDAAIPLDLRTIVLKALAKDPAERYATAGELAGDLTLFLADQPIRARPLTLLPLAIKRARRHWRALAAAGLLTSLLLIGVAAASLWSNARLRAVNQRLETEIDRADHHAREANDHARRAQRHALGAQLRLAAQALDAGQPERAQEILRDIPLNAGCEAPRSFVWRHLWRRARRDVVVLVGPTPRFVGMALSPDGKLLATSDATAGLRVRDADSGVPIRDMEAVPGPIEGPAFSTDGSLVAAPDRGTDAASPDGFSIWEVASGRRLVRLPIDQRFDTLTCSFLPGGAFLGVGANASREPLRRARVWSLADGPSHPRMLEQFERCPDVDSASAVGAFVTCEGRSTLVRRDVRTGQPVQKFDVGGANENIGVWACSAGGDLVAAVSEPGRRLTIWDGHTGRFLVRHAVPERVDRLYFSPDGGTLAAIDGKDGVHLVERASGAIHRIVSGQAEHAYHARIAFSPEGGRIATAFSLRSKGEPAPVSIWETATGRRLATFPGRSEEWGNPIFTPDRESLLISSRSGVRRWRLAPADGDSDRQPAGHKDEAWAVAFSPGGGILATGSDDTEPDPTIKLWDTSTSRMTRAWHGGVGTVASLAFSPDGRILASGHLTPRTNVQIWDAASGRRLAILEGHTDRVRAVTFARDGKCLATASSDGDVRLWDAASWRERSVLRGHADTVHAVAFSPDGTTLASAGNDGDIRLWDVRSGDGSSPPPRVLHNRANLMAVAFAPDGKTLAVADTLGSITIWDLDRVMPIRLIHCDGEALRQLAFTPDGMSLAAAGMKGVIRLWDPATGQELASLAAHHAQINGLAFSPDGSILGSAAHDGSVRLWRAEP